MRSSEAQTASDIVAAAQLACLLEATAPKPGNVSPDRDFADLAYEDLLASAAAIGGPLAGAGARPLGTTVRLAIDATGRWTRSNSNLGLVLLLAPLTRAAMLAGKGVGTRFREKQSKTSPDPFSDLRDLRGAVRTVLEDTTVDDAREVYAAIRRAAPAGLGRVEQQDVADEPSVTLLEAMRLGAGHDDIAHEYATGFEITFERAVPTLQQARADGLCWSDAIVETFLGILAARPDSHVARRGGAALAADVSRRACAAVAVGGVRTEEGRRVIADTDRALRDPRHLANPGTTADLMAAAIFVVLVDGIMKT
jgi:triphosphoribosyl-dephospho-CoA synthase